VDIRGAVGRGTVATVRIPLKKAVKSTGGAREGAFIGLTDAAAVPAGF